MNSMRVVVELLIRFENMKMRLITWCDGLAGFSLELGLMVDNEYDLRDLKRNLFVKLDNDDNDAENRIRFVAEFVVGCSSCVDWLALRLLELPMKLAKDVQFSFYNLQTRNFFSLSIWTMLWTFVYIFTTKFGLKPIFITICFLSPLNKH